MQEFKEMVHYDKQMETALLGACLLESDAFARVRGLISEDCFYLDYNKQVYKTMVEMWENNMPIDLLIVAQYLVSKGVTELNGGNIPYHLTTLTGKVTSTSNIEYYATKIREMWAKRRLIELPYEMKEGDLFGNIEKMRDELTKITQIKTVNDWRDMDEVIIGLHKHMEEVKDKDIIGIPTGFSKFDRVTGGLIKGEITVLAARPSVGKSALLGAMAINAAQSHFKVAIISLEMSEVQIGARMGSFVSGADFYKIFRNQFNDEQERDEVYKSLLQLAHLPIKISDKTKVNINDIRAKVGQLKTKNQIDVLFVDYLQLLDSEEGKKNYSREQEVAKMSRGFKLMSKEFDIPIVLLAQLNRESEKSANKKPLLGHLRESGAIEQDADLVVFLHRDWKAGILQDSMGNSTEHEADLIIAKGRNIETPEIKIGFDGSKMKFYDLDKGFTKLPYRVTNNDPF